MKIYLLAGQSNMLGLAQAENHIRAAQYHKAWIYSNSSQARWNTRVSVGFGLQSAIDNADYKPLLSFGPELTFADIMLENKSPDEQIGLIKYAVSGTHLHGDWQPDTRSYNQYRALLKHFNRAIDALPEKFDPVVAGFVWIQGETDATNVQHARAYQSNLNRFIKALRAAIWQQRTNRYSVTGNRQLPVVIARIAPVWGDYGKIIRQAQLHISRWLPNIVIIGTDNLSLRSDGIHYDATGQRRLGALAAKALLEINTKALLEINK